MDALVSVGRRKAFDNLAESWCSELDTFTNADSTPLMDLIFLTSEVDNRVILSMLQDKKDKLNSKNDEKIKATIISNLD